MVEAELTSPPKVKVRRSFYRRVIFRRLYWLQVPKIIARRLREPRDDRAIFVSRMGGVGDLVNLFPAVAYLAKDHPIDMGTGPGPSSLLVSANPFVRRTYAPFVWKAGRVAQQKRIHRLLGPFYERVLLCDETESQWWVRGPHMSARFAQLCGTPIPDRGAVYIPAHYHRLAETYLRRAGLEKYIFVAQVIRRHRPYRSWPLGHFFRLYELLRRAYPYEIVVDPTGGDPDRTEIPTFCRRLEAMDVLAAAAVIARANFFIGLDSGLTHVAAALGIPTVAIHLGYPPEVCRPLGDNVCLIRQPRPFYPPELTRPEEVFERVIAFVQPSR